MNYINNIMVYITLYYNLILDTEKKLLNMYDYLTKDDIVYLIKTIAR